MALRYVIVSHLYNIVISSYFSLKHHLFMIIRAFHFHHNSFCSAILQINEQFMIPIFSWAFINKFVIQNWSMKQDANHKMLRHSSFRRQSSYIVLVVLEGGHNQPTINLLMYIRCNNCSRKPSTRRYYSFRVASGSRTETLTLWVINGYCKRKVVKMGHLAVSLRRVAIQKIMTLLYEDSFEIGQQSIGRWTDVMETLFETLQRCVGGGEETREHLQPST